MDLKKLIDAYVDSGYEYDDASSKVCQDIILMKIANSKLSKNVTIKGGVVMHNISDDMRRTTRDLDLDFIRYSLEDQSIINFISELNNVKDDIKIEVIGKILPLHHQDYDGKRVFIKISDNNKNKIETKLDIGIHKLFDIEQEEYCFNFDIINKNATLLINSKEQIFTEKLKSLLKLGRRSTRYKDIFDFYYLINTAKLDKDKLLKFFNILIFNEETMREKSISDIFNRLHTILTLKAYQQNLEDSKVNWLDISSDKVIQNILDFIKILEYSIV